MLTLASVARPEEINAFRLELEAGYMLVFILV
jgi:hypothetical protein